MGFTSDKSHSLASHGDDVRSRKASRKITGFHSLTQHRPSACREAVDKLPERQNGSKDLSE